LPGVAEYRPDAAKRMSVTDSLPAAATVFSPKACKYRIKQIIYLKSITGDVIDFTWIVEEGNTKTGIILSIKPNGYSDRQYCNYNIDGGTLTINTNKIDRPRYDIFDTGRFVFQKTTTKSSSNSAVLPAPIEDPEVVDGFDLADLSKDAQVALRQIRLCLDYFGDRQFSEGMLLASLREHLRLYLGDRVESAMEELREKGILDELIADYVLPDTD